MTSMLMDSRIMKENIKIIAYDMNYVLKEPALLCRLRELTLHSGSGLNHELNAFSEIVKTRMVHAKALSAYLDDRMVAWALLSKEPSTFMFWYESFKAGDGVLFEVYVEPIHRRKGIGTALLNKAKFICSDKKICICPHDYASNNFYHNFHRYNPEFNYKSL